VVDRLSTLSSTRPEGENCRPAAVFSLLCEANAADMDSGWYFANKTQNRFFVVNLEHVMGALGIDYTRTRQYFEKASEVIAKETNWGSQYYSDYICSHTQLKPTRRHEAKHFGHAVTIIVAMEIAAAEKRINFNVYDTLRILPANYFVDRLDRQRLSALRAHYEAMSDHDRAEKFGTADATKSFDNLCLSRIGQAFSEGLLDEIAEGYCLTKFSADLIVKFITEHFPESLSVGPVRVSGEDSISKGLGTKRAAAKLRVPRRLDRSKLSVCR
jgi:hypothetical protein